MSFCEPLVESPFYPFQARSSATPLVSVRHSSFKSSEILTPEQQERFSQKNIEILQSPPEWKFVERLINGKIITDAPVNPTDTFLASGWKPQKSVAELKEKYPYYVNRTKNHQVPVYLLSTFRGQRKVTKLKRVEGDIWALEKDLKEALQLALKKKVETRVNEVSGQIDFKGIHVDMISVFLMQKGF